MLQPLQIQPSKEGVNSLADYTTKPIEELRESALLITKNIAPLIGCKLNEIGWSPMVGYQVCKELRIVGTECSNLAKQRFATDFQIYQFETAVTTETNHIYRSVLDYSSSVLNTSYIMYIKNKLPSRADTSEKLHLTAKYCRYTDSTIFDAIYQNDSIRFLPQYMQICHILLCSFTLRYHLYQFADGDEWNASEINSYTIHRIVNNIDYVNYYLGQDKTVTEVYQKSKEFIRQHLTMLKKNLLMMIPALLAYIK